MNLHMRSTPSSRNARKYKSFHRAAFLSGFLAMIFAACGVQAQPALRGGLGGSLEVETKWPGVRLQLFRIERSNPLNRLIVAVRVLATEQAPRSGTFLGTRTTMPANATREQVAMGLYDPKPFSLADSEMTEDQTGRKYSALPPIAPPGKKYPPSTILKSLLPGQSEILTIQFAIPPLTSGDEPRKQTATFVFPSAKASIANVPIPSVEAAQTNPD